MPYHKFRFEISKLMGRVLVAAATVAAGAGAAGSAVIVAALVVLVILVLLMLKFGRCQVGGKVQKKGEHHEDGCYRKRHVKFAAFRCVHV